MRVLHLTTEFPPVIYGGLGTAIGGLAMASAQAGLTVGVLLVGETARDGYAVGRAKRNAVRKPQPMVTSDHAVALFQTSWYDALDTAMRLVKQWQPELIHLHPFWLWPVARALQAQTGLPLVYTVHSLDRAEYELGQGPPECLIQWATQETVIAMADRVIALTHSERELLSQYCPRARERVRVVGNGIEEDQSARQKARHTAQATSPVVLYSGRFVDRKGIRELIAAIPQVLAQAPTAQFVLAGGHRHSSGWEMERAWLPPDLRRYRGRIHFTGWLAPHEMAAWYRIADVLVVPSWYEPFGMVILEGMLHGLPIAAAAVGGPSEILAHGHTGLLFPPKDVRALATVVLQLVQNANLRRQLGDAAADEVRRYWLWPCIVEKMRTVYQEAVLTRRGHVGVNVKHT